MAVAVRGALEYALDPTHLDARFVRIAGDRDDRQLLFATGDDRMATVVCRVQPSVHAAYRADDHRSVSVSAVYARLAHGVAVADGVWGYHPALEVSGTCPGLWIAVPVRTCAGIGAWSVGPMAEWLKGSARGANSGRYRKATRGPKRPKPPRTRFPDAKHVATSRLLNGEQT